MDNLNEKANLIKEKLISFMKSREMGDPLFNQTMQLIAKLKNAQNEVLKYNDEISKAENISNLSQNASSALLLLQKILDECESYINPKVNYKPTLSSGSNVKSQVLLTQKELTFVSIDVQGSEDLKQNEDNLKVSKAFSNYFMFVEKIMKENNVKKYSWAGDGFIAYFENAENAISACLLLMGTMPYFNLTLNQLSKNFKVRIGISTGEDYFDEKCEIGKMTSKVIDLAGYLQKKAAIKDTPKTFTRILASQNTILKIHKNAIFQRTLKITKIDLEADENKKIQAMSAFEIYI